MPTILIPKHCCHLMIVFKEKLNIHSVLHRPFSNWRILFFSIRFILHVTLFSQSKYLWRLTDIFLNLILGFFYFLCTSNCWLETSILILLTYLRRETESCFWEFVMISIISELSVRSWWFFIVTSHSMEPSTFTISYTSLIDYSPKTSLHFHFLFPVPSAW